MDETTIAALATAPAPAGVAVIRVSGPRTKFALRALFRGKRDPLRTPRTLVFGDILDFKSGGVIDRGLAVFMPAPWSFTGEDVAEFQFHGSPVLVQQILRSIYAYGITPAAAGEFSKRAFLNGKLDLTQAEAIADLINAKGEEELRCAGEQLKGRLSQAVEQLGEPLRDLLAELEAAIDFPDEDISPARLEALVAPAERAAAKVRQLLSSYQYGARVKQGVKVLLCGAPNVGKSSLLNLLLNKRRAIVSEISGTTRDLLEEQATIQGYSFIFCDSAGMRDTTDTVEQIGIELAKERIPWADLVLWVVDATDTSGGWREELQAVRAQARAVWMVINKIDLNPAAFSQEPFVPLLSDSSLSQQNFFISARSGAGVPALMEALVQDLAQVAPEGGDVGEVVTNERHRDCLERAERSLEAFCEGVRGGEVPITIAAADIKSALGALDEVVGKTYTEDILGRIFSKFCIGK